MSDTREVIEVASGRDWRMLDLRGMDWVPENRTVAGVRVTPETALQCSAFLACVRVISESVASLPLHLYERVGGGDRVRADSLPLYRMLHQQPNSWQTALEFREQMTALYLMYGQSFAEIVGNSRVGSVAELRPLHPANMTVERIEDGRLRYRYREPGGTGRETIYRQDQIFHLRFLSLDGINGIVPTTVCRDAIALARALEQHGGAFFGNGARPGVVLESDNPIPAEAAERLREAWERMHRGADRAFRTAVLPNGVKAKELSGSNEAAQYLETRQYQVIEICRAFRMPPHMIQDLTRSTYSNIEVQGTEFVQHCLLPHLKRWEAAIARDLIADDERYHAEHNVHGLLRGDSAAQSAFVTAMLDRGVYDIDEARAYLGMPPLPAGSGKLRLVPLNMQTVESAVAGPPDPPAPEPMPAADPADSPADIADDGGQQRALPRIGEARALTISIDFDRTFAADPELWGLFARQAVAGGNTVVMISRREDTAENQATITETLGQWRDYFSRVLLIGTGTLKEAAAREAEIAVDVWVDDSPYTISDRQPSRPADGV
jgi:HK97 family phage portal protein